ncbi:14502_t:CDS:2, partial [Gigaspora margarita]
TKSEETSQATSQAENSQNNIQTEDSQGFEETPNYDSESDSSEDENKSDISFYTQENQSKNDLELIVKDIKNIIYNLLFEYWNCPSQICLLATLLDPWLKEMPFANEETHDNTIEECRHQLHQLMNVQPPTSNEHATSPSAKNLSSNNMFKELIFGSTQRPQEFMDELDFYLDLRQTPVAFPDIDPLL